MEKPGAQFKELENRTKEKTLRLGVCASSASGRNNELKNIIHTRILKFIYGIIQYNKEELNWQKNVINPLRLTIIKTEIKQSSKYFKIIF